MLTNCFRCFSKSDSYHRENPIQVQIKPKEKHPIKQSNLSHNQLIQANQEKNTKIMKPCTSLLRRARLADMAVL